MDFVHSRLVDDVIKDGVLKVQIETNTACHSASFYYVQIYSHKISLTSPRSDHEVKEFFLSKQCLLETVSISSNPSNALSAESVSKPKSSLRIRMKKNKKESENLGTFTLIFSSLDMHFKLKFFLETEIEMNIWKQIIYKAQDHFSNASTELECEIDKLEALQHSPFNLPQQQQQQPQLQQLPRKKSFKDKLKRVQDFRRKSAV